MTVAKKLGGVIREIEDDVLPRLSPAPGSVLPGLCTRGVCPGAAAQSHTGPQGLRAQGTFVSELPMHSPGPP